MGGFEGLKSGEGRAKGAATDSSVELSSAFSKRLLGWWNRTILQSTLAKPREDGEALNVLITTHGGVIGALILELVGSRKIKRSAGVEVSRCMNASVTVVELDSNKKGLLVKYGDVAHLKGLDVLGVQYNADEIAGERVG